ncbi:MAG TPA: GNAT family N-acetyltransferase [Phototrophicaceae bacterium]|nr:GNAT family N-acetyltransferase [Phototrophicaceae bacterium]
MHPLPFEQFATVRPLFIGQHLELVIDGIIAGNSPVLIWVDDLARPRTAYIWDKFHCHYLAGNPHNATFNAELCGLIAEQLLPTITPPVFVKVTYTPEWEPHVPALFPAIELKLYPRVFLTLNNFNGSEWRRRIPDGFTMQPINAALLGNTSLNHVTEVLAEIRQCWPSVEQFLANGFGFCLVHHQEEIAGWCTGEYRSAGKCGIGIETVEAYQRRGLAQLTASALVEHALAAGLAPHWDSWARNVPSVAVAEKIGFRVAVNYSAYVGVFEPHM